MSHTDLGPRSAGPPVTGHPAIDAATASVADLAEVPLADHHGRLADAHDVLHRALHAETAPET